MLPTIMKTLRQRDGLTQAELAKKLGVSRSSIYAYEAGTREPGNDTLTKMSHLFRCSVDYLLTGKSGLTVMQTDKPFVDETESFDQFGNSSGPIPNYNTLFTGDSERDADLAALLEDLRTREDMRMLFKLAHGATPDDVRQAVKIIEALRKE